jgi:hypothetical protein
MEPDKSPDKTTGACTFGVPDFRQIAIALRVVDSASWM